MTMLLRFAGLAAAGLLLAAGPRRVVHSETLTHPQTGHALGCIPSDAEKAFIYEVLVQLNEYRLANGRSALVHDLTLQAAMLGHCHHMAEHGFFDHVHAYATEPESQNPGLRTTANGGGQWSAENIAFGQTTPTQVMNAWKLSAGHNANMLDGSHTRVGIGYYSGGNYWGQLFGVGAAISPEANSPSVASPAAAVPSTVTGTTAALSVLGMDDGGEAGLTYTWTMFAGPAAPGFSPNGTNAAKNTTATFTQAGNYTLRATMQDAQGLITTSDVSLTVNATLTSAVVTPHPVSVQTGGLQTFSAAGLDQFGNALAAAFTWAVSGGGSIDGLGNFTAGGAPGGPFTVTATSGSVSDTADVTVTASAPILTTILVLPSAVLVLPGGAQDFNAIGLDQVGNPLAAQPAMTWSVSGGGSIDGNGLFSSSGLGGSFTVTATSGAVSGTGTVTVPEDEEDAGPCGATGFEALLPFLAPLLRRRRSLSGA
jgi:hypothetical protein